MKLNINLKNRQLYFYGIFVLCLLLSGVLFFWVILPRIRSWASFTKDIGYKEKELRVRYKTTEENQRLRQDIAKIEETYKEQEKMFFDKGDMPSAVKEITSISQDLQIEFISITAQATQEIKEAFSQTSFSLWKIPISIKIKTDYAKLIDFIKRIENSQKFIKIDDIRIKKNLSTLPIHDVEMTVYIFSLSH